MAFYQLTKENYRETARGEIASTGEIYYSLNIPGGWKIEEKTVLVTEIYPPLFGILQAILSPKTLRVVLKGVKGRGTVHVRGIPAVPLPLPFNYASFSVDAGETVEGDVKLFLPFEKAEIYSYYRAETEEEAAKEFREFAATVSITT